MNMTCCLLPVVYSLLFVCICLCPCHGLGPASWPGAAPWDLVPGPDHGMGIGKDNKQQAIFNTHFQQKVKCKNVSKSEN